MHYSPVRHSTPASKLASFPFDLHVLGMPPAFNLSHDQTLQFIFFDLLKGGLDLAQYRIKRITSILKLKCVQPILIIF